MSKRTASWLAWFMCALSLALTGLSLLLLVQTRSHPDVRIFDYWAIDSLVAIGFSTVGAVIAPRLSSKNPIGWLFCAVGLSFGMIHFTAEYTMYALLAAPGTLPGGEAAAWIFSLTWVPTLGLTVFLMLLFPDGRLPSRRWRWLVWLSVFLIVVGTISQVFAPRLVLDIGGIYSPLGVEGLPNVWKLIQTLLFTLMFVSAASLVVRWVRASGVERLQLKWFAYSTTLGISGIILTYTISETTGLVWLGWVGYVVLLAGFIGIPTSMGIAILRYRLYEIDLIINRTLVYGALTAILALVYFGSVTALQYLFSLLTGQGNTLAIVASTLAIAALFNPLRRRIQGVIDRRFYRRKYDAAKTLEAFGTKLRDQTDLEKLCEDLGEVVDETMQPSHISLWLSFPSSPVRSESRSEVRSRSISKQSAPPQ
ncbi:MAG: hypothetical protein M3283_10715 [Actinomycetota bacterium]|nr:hypothetical protein [Actinomycetota bacterium]